MIILKDILFLDKYRASTCRTYFSNIFYTLEMTNLILCDARDVLLEPYTVLFDRIYYSGKLP